MKDRRLEQITDKNGVRTHRWKKGDSGVSSNADALRSAFGSREVKAKPRRSAKRAVEQATGYPVDAQDATVGVLVGTRDEWNGMSDKDRAEAISAAMRQIHSSTRLKIDYDSWTDVGWRGNIFAGKGLRQVADARSHEISSISPNPDDLDEVHVVDPHRVLGDGDDDHPKAFAAAERSRHMMTALGADYESGMAHEPEVMRVQSEYLREATDGDSRINATMYMGPSGPIYKADKETAHAAQGAAMGAPLMPVPVHVGKRYDLLSAGHPTTTKISRPSDARPEDDDWYRERNANMRKLGVFNMFDKEEAHIQRDSPLRRYPWMLETPERVESISKAYREKHPEFGKANDLEATMLDAGAWREMWSNKRGLFG